MAHRDPFPSVVRPGFAPDFHGNEIVLSCEHCAELYDDSDHEYGGMPWWCCDKKPHMCNLKGFPFKTTQKCGRLNSMFLYDWDAIEEEL